MKRATAALFSWSLRADANNSVPHMIRGAFAVFVLLAVSAAWLDALSTVGPGLRFFSAICYMNVFLITVAGMSYFVSAVSEEKDAGTLALLKLAGAPPLGIILSKSTSRLISAVMLLMIQLPFTFLAVTLGGVTWDQVLAAYLALTAWLCLVSCAALFCSVISVTSGVAAVRATGMLLALFALGPLSAAVAAMALPAWAPKMITDVAATISDWHTDLMVVSRLNVVLSAAGVSSLFAAQFWWSMASGGTLFVVSTVLFNRLAHAPSEANLVRSKVARRVTVGRAWPQFIVWKDFLFFTGGIPAVLGRCLLYGGVVVGFVAYDRLDGIASRAWLADPLAWTCFLTLLAILTLEGLFYASGLLVHEVEQKTIGPLALIPAETWWIMIQKTIACGIALIPGMLCLGGVVIMNTPAILSAASVTMLIWYLFNVLLCVHLTVLISLHSRWAALPVALFLTAAANMCFPLIVLSFIQAITSMAQANGVYMTGWMVVFVNFAWAWLFVLLPIELEILKSWHRLAERT